MIPLTLLFTNDGHPTTIGLIIVLFTMLAFCAILMLVGWIYSFITKKSPTDNMLFMAGNLAFFVVLGIATIIGVYTIISNL